MNTKTIPNRIRIRTTKDVRHYLQTYPFQDITDFFIEYEAKNRILPKTEVVERMKQALHVMQESVSKGSRKANTTPSGLINGGCKKLLEYAHSDANPVLLGSEFMQVITNTLAVSELNSCMGRIVATPTAGACGVLPGAFFTVCNRFSVSEEKQINALFIGGGIGELIRINASLSGSQHGCQAEIGSASAITAAAIASLFKTSLDTIESAAAIALD